MQNGIIETMKTSKSTTISLYTYSNCICECKKTIPAERNKSNGTVGNRLKTRLTAKHKK